MDTIGKCRKWVNRKLGLLLSTFLTLVGFLFSIGNDYFSQFNYAFEEIRKDICSPDNDVNFVEITQDTLTDKLKPKYFFILDVSASSKEKTKKVPLNSVIREQINAVQVSGYCDNKGFDFGAKDKSTDNNFIEFNRFLQLRLLHALKILYDNKKDSLDYNVVLFSDNPEVFKGKDINETFKFVYGQPHDGGKTNFVNLLTCLKNNIKSSSVANITKRRECHLYFFSDYLHDLGDKLHKGQIADDERELKIMLHDMHERNIDIKLHYLDTGVFSKNRTPKSGTPVEKHFFEIFPFSKIDILNVDYGLICPVLSKKPLFFHYTNTVFEDTLKAIIDFKDLKKNKKYLFGLNYNTDAKDNIKQEYYLIKGDSTIHLSKHLQSVQINRKEKVTLMIQGYIPAPYKSPDIIIEDEEEGVQHIIPVFFYRNFPFTGKLLLCPIVLIFIVIIINLISSIVAFFDEPSLEKENEEIRQTLNHNKEETVCCEDKAGMSVVSIKEHNRIISEKEKEKKEISKKLDEREHELYSLKNKLSKTEYDIQQLEEKLSQYKEKQ